MHETLGHTVRKARLEKRLSYRKLGEASGLSVTTIRRIEAGEGEPYPQTLYALADALGLDPESLVALSEQNGSAA